MMDREILYHGKRLDNGEWVEGSLLGNDVIVPQAQTFVIEGNKIYGCDLIAYEVDPDTVGQCTGLTDKNGVKVFEGDKVKVCLDPEICQGTVRYNDKIAAFIISIDKNPDIFEDNDKCVLFLDIFQAQIANADVWVEVIGNIHDREGE